MVSASERIIYVDLSKKVKRFLNEKQRYVTTNSTSQWKGFTAK